MVKVPTDFRFNCLGIMIFGAETAADVRKAVLNYRNTWFHPTIYDRWQDSG